jgi:hypothetical protein
MTDAAFTDRVTAQGRALVRAIEALREIEPSGWFERALARLLLAGYRRRLRGILAVVPDWTKAAILGVSSGDKSMVLWEDDEEDTIG